MREVGLLLKNRFVNTYNLNSLFKTKKKKMFVYLLLAIYIIVSLFITAFSYANQVADLLIQYQMISFMLVFFFATTSFAIFMFSCFYTKSGIFNANDNDLLLSMPLKPSSILGSRLIHLIIWNLLISLFIMIPTVLVYAEKMNVTFSYYIFILFICLLLPVIPTILASIIGYFVAYLTSKVNAKHWFEIIISLLFIGGIYYVMFNINDIISYAVTNINNLEEILKWGFYPIYLVGEMFKYYDYLSLFIYIILNIGLFSLFTYLLSINFKKIIMKLQENRSKSNYKLENLKTASVSKALYIKEMKRYFSSPIYVLNTSFGLIILAVAAVASIFYSMEQILTVLELSDVSTNLFQLLVPALMFVIFMSCTTSASISLEGKNFWILKSLPIHPSMILKNKILFNLSMVLPITFVSLIILYFASWLGGIELTLLFILSFVLSIASAQFGLLMNLYFPKMDAVNDVVIVKRSASVLVSVLVPVVVIFGLVGLYSLIDVVMDFYYFSLIIIMLLVFVNIIQHYLLNTWGIERFREID